MDLNKEFYTTREVGKLFGMTSHWVRSEIQRNNLKAEKFGTSYAITRSAIEKFIENRKARGL